jgi:hypothetical protein
MARRFLTLVRLAVVPFLALTGIALLANPASATTSTTTTVTRSAAVSGSPVTFTATVVHGAGVPTGSVTFTVTGASLVTYSCDAGNVANLSPNMSGPGSVATCKFAGGLAASDSPYTVNAVYSGDSNFTTSNGTLTTPIKKGSTSTTVTSASFPSVTGQPVSFTATVAPVSPATGTPTGSVTFSINGTGGGSVACDTTGDTVPLTGNTATCSVAAGFQAQFNPYTVSASYSGDSDFMTSSGSFSQTVAKASATLSVTGSVSGTLYTGQAVSYTATVTGVTPPGSGSPTGNIVFSVVGSGGGTVANCQGGNTQPLSGSTATCNIPGGLLAKPLSYVVTATLQDPNYKSPVAGSLSQLVTKAPTSTTVSGVPISVIASQRFDVHVTIQTQAPAGGVPVGYIEWSACNVHDTTQCPAGGTYQLPAPTPSDIANNQMVIHFSVAGGIRTPGLYGVVAQFFGGNNYQNSFVSNQSTMVVQKVPTSMGLQMSSNPVRNENRLVIRASIISNSNASPSLGAPSGTVTFSIVGASGDVLTCSTGSNVVQISTNAQNQGFAACTIPNSILSSTDSPYEVQAQYSGDSAYDSVSGSTAVVVKNI